MRIEYEYEGNDYTAYVGVDGPEEKAYALIGEQPELNKFGCGFISFTENDGDLDVSITGFNSAGKTENFKDDAVDTVTWLYPYITTDMLEVAKKESKVTITSIYYATPDGKEFLNDTPITLFSCSEVRARQGVLIPVPPNPYPEELPEPGTGAEGSIPPKVTRDADYALVYHGGPNNAILEEVMTVGIPEESSTSNYSSYLIEDNYSTDISTFLNGFLSYKDSVYSPYFGKQMLYWEKGEKTNKKHAYGGMLYRVCVFNKETGEVVDTYDNFILKQRDDITVLDELGVEHSIGTLTEISKTDNGDLSSIIATITERHRSEYLSELALAGNIAKPDGLPTSVVRLTDIDRGIMGITPKYALSVSVAALAKATSAVPTTYKELNETPYKYPEMGGLPIYTFRDLIVTPFTSASWNPEGIEYVDFKFTSLDLSAMNRADLNIYLTDIYKEITEDSPDGLILARAKLN